eukprot:6185984-Pleurochrysis_carterae.AAC.5
MAHRCVRPPFPRTALTSTFERASSLWMQAPPLRATRQCPRKMCLCCASVSQAISDDDSDSEEAGQVEATPDKFIPFGQARKQAKRWSARERVKMRAKDAGTHGDAKRAIRLHAAQRFGRNPA